MIELSNILQSYQKALNAAKYLRPPGFFKRAAMRETPRKKTGPFENPVKRFVRIREKARLYSLILPPRRIPIVKPITKTLLQPITGVIQVDPIILERRLDFLLSDKAKLQQLAAKIRPGITPYQAELFVWERQMRDLRKIYRAQYLQKLQQVTEDERHMQLNIYANQQKEKRLRRLNYLQSLLQERKRKALLVHRMNIEKKINQSMEFKRLSQRKISNIYWLTKLQRAANFIDSKNLMDKLSPESREILNRDVSVPDLSKSLGNDIEEAKSIKHKIVSGDGYFRRLMEESFAILDEDAERYEKRDDVERMSDSERADITYQKFTDEEKLALVDEKIEIIREAINAETQVKKDGNQLMIQILDHLEAAKLAFLERKKLQSGKLVSGK